MSTTYDTRRMASEMSGMKQAKYECRHYTRKVWLAMLLTISLIIGLGALSRAIYQHGKAVQHANDTR